MTSNPDVSCALGFRVPTNTPMMLLSFLPIGRHTVYDAKVVDTDDLIFLSCDEHTLCIPVEEPSTLSPRLLELCAGFGGMGIGASFLGAIPTVSVDWNFLSISHLQLNDHGLTLQLDLQDLDSSKAIHAAFGGTPGTATLGFPCQPHSSQGKGLGSQDPRHLTLWGGLRTIFLCQCQTAILECVPAAGQNGDVLYALNLIAEAMNWDILTVDLELADRWPCRRRRWWALLLPKDWNRCGLQAWPATSTFSWIGAVLPGWKAWSTAEEDDLQLFDFELAAYSNPCYGSDCRLLSLESIAACFLHSYGNALTGCPCGCRATAFSDVTLRSGGLRGSFVQSAVHGNPRFLHHRELALLLGVPDAVSYAGSPRSNLALLGLISSPLQMVWVYGTLRYNVSLVMEDAPLPHPLHWLEAYCNELLRQSALRFRPTESLPIQISIDDADGNPLHLCSAHSFTVGQLLNAERINLQWNFAGGVTQSGIFLPMDQLMDQITGPSTLNCEEGQVPRLMPTGQIMIAIIHHTDYFVAMLCPGQFLFEALRELDLHCNFLIDNQGKIYGADFRTWRSLRLFTLPNWPPRNSPLFGLGTFSMTLGLHDGHLWHALTSAFKGLSNGPALMHPRLAFALLHGLWDEGDFDQLTLDFSTKRALCCIFESQKHWALLWGQLDGTEINWTYSDGLPGLSASAAGLLAGRITHILGLADWTIQSHHPISQVDSHTCGTIALVLAFQRAGLFGMPSNDNIRDLHQWLLDLPLIGVLHGDGLSPMLQDQLTKLLINHGVPVTAVADRVNLITQKLGPAAVLEAAQAKNPWAYLKALASKPSINLRLVHADELTKHVEASASAKFGADVKQHKQKKKTDKKKGSSNDPPLEPSMLILAPNGFRDADDDEVPQIDFDEVTAEAHGIALCSTAQAFQLLQTNKSISSFPLGLLVLDPPHAEFMAKNELRKMTFSATYKGTGEPIIVFGAFKSLGDSAIKQVIPGNTNRPALVETQVVKIQIFRDEFQGSWDSLIASPVKVLCQHVPLLQLCPGRECGTDCPRSHAAIDEELDTILMEIWSRTFASIDGSKVAAPESALFWVFIRVPMSIVHNLIQHMAAGIYFEPRDDNKSHDAKYRVIWLPAKSRDQALHAFKTCLHSLSLVRMKMKYGIRVASDDEEAAFKALKPDSVYIDTQVQRVFQLFPLPHGLQRAGVSKLLAGLDWKVKPLQPGKGNSTAMSWTVGAATAPPQSIITGFGSEIIISEITKITKPVPPPTFLASQKTKKHLQTEASSSSAGQATSSDPWTRSGEDPWCNYNAKKPVPAKTHYQELKAEMTASIHKEVADLRGKHPAGPVATEVEQRFSQLESTLSEVQAQGLQFQSWFQTMGQQLTASEANIQTMQTTLSLHQNELHGVKSDLQSMPDMVSKSIQGALQVHKDESSNALDERFNRLEALLTGKMQRRE